MTGENIVALCDVDERSAAASVPGRRNPPGDAFARYGRAKKFNDYRRMLDELDREIDAVVVSTPNHNHAPASVAATMRRGKHVYCEKPGSNSVFEARMLAKVAAEQQVATQLGTQMHASDNYRRVVELIRGGAIGAVEGYHIWLRSAGSTNDRPDRDATRPPRASLGSFPGAGRLTAPITPPIPAVAAANWHRWWDFGSGNFGNMGCHYLSLPFWALNLRYPISVEAEGPPPHPETTPGQLHARYRFPGPRRDAPGHPDLDTRQSTAAGFRGKCLPRLGLGRLRGHRGNAAGQLRAADALAGEKVRGLRAHPSRVSLRRSV